MTSASSLLKAGRSTEPALPTPVERRIVNMLGGRSIAFAQAGSGRDCLLIHGTLMTLEDMWLGPAPMLAESFRITVVDRPGHGMSHRRRLVDASPWRQAQILHDFASAAELDQPVLVGHSYGGTVALAYAMLFPQDTQGVVALAPMCLPEPRLEALLFGPRCVPGFGDWITPLLGASIDPMMLRPLWHAMFLPQVMPDDFAASFPFPLAARFGQMVAEGEDAAVLVPTLAAMAGRYASCRVPARFLGGTADIVVNNAMQGFFAAALMPNASFSWETGCGHMLHHFARDAIVDAVSSLHVTA